MECQVITLFKQKNYSKILRHLKKLSDDVALLQEKHLMLENFLRLKKTWVGEVIGSPAIGRKASVTILIEKHRPYMTQNIETDNTGHRASVTITQNNMPQAQSLTITNV